MRTNTGDERNMPPPYWPTPYRDCCGIRSSAAYSSIRLSSEHSPQSEEPFPSPGASINWPSSSIDEFVRLANIELPCRMTCSHRIMRPTCSYNTLHLMPFAMNGCFAYQCISIVKSQLGRGCVQKVSYACPRVTSACTVQARLAGSWKSNTVTTLN